MIYKIKPDFIITCTPKIILYGIFISIFLRIKRVHIYTGIYWELFHGFKKILYSLIDKINFSQCKRVFFDSNYQINFFKNKGYNTKNFSLISRGSVKGVNLNIFYKNDNLRQIQRSKYNLKNTDKVILFLGRLDHNKGVVCLLDAFKILSKIITIIFFF